MPGGSKRSDILEQTLGAKDFNSFTKLWNWQVFLPKQISD